MNMKLTEIDKVIDLIETRGLCKMAEARDGTGREVHMDSPLAHSFDLRAALALAMGKTWRDGLEASYKAASSIHENLTGEDYIRSKAKAYARLADWNDLPNVTQAVVVYQLAEWRKRLVTAGENKHATRKLRSQMPQ